MFEFTNDGSSKRHSGNNVIKPLPTIAAVSVGETLIGDLILVSLLENYTADKLGPVHMFVVIKGNLIEKYTEGM